MTTADPRLIETTYGDLAPGQPYVYAEDVADVRPMRFGDGVRDLWFPCCRVALPGMLSEDDRAQVVWTRKNWR